MQGGSWLRTQVASPYTHSHGECVEVTCGTSTPSLSPHGALGAFGQLSEGDLGIVAQLQLRRRGHGYAGPRYGRAILASWLSCSYGSGWGSD